MSRITRSVVFVLAAVGLVAVVQSGVKALQSNPLVLTGSDVGFRVEGEYNGKPYGTFVVKLNGKWVEVGAGVGRVVPAAR